MSNPTIALGSQRWSRNGVEEAHGRQQEDATTISTLQTVACNPALWGGGDDIREAAGRASRLAEQLSR